MPMSEALLWRDFPLALVMSALQAAVLALVISALLCAPLTGLAGLGYVNGLLWGAVPLFFLLGPALIVAALKPAADSKPLLVMTAGMNQQ